MNRGKLTRIVLIITCVLILIGIALMAWMLVNRNNRNVIHIDLDDQIDPIGFKNLCLIPGESCAYTLRLTGDEAEQYDAHLRFEETQVGTLKHYAYIRIEANGQVLCDQLMATMFEGETIDLFVDLRQVEQQEITITYYLPIEVGNEVQNAEAVFDLLITASNE